MKRLLSMVLLAAPLTAIADDLKLGIIGSTRPTSGLYRDLQQSKRRGSCARRKSRGGIQVEQRGYPSSADRVEEYTAKLQKDYGVKLVGSIEELCREVDGVLSKASMAGRISPRRARNRGEEAPLHR